MPPTPPPHTQLFPHRPSTLSSAPSALLLVASQVVQVCAEHKKPAKLLRHLAAVKVAGATMRNPPRVLVFANRIKVRGRAQVVPDAGNGTRCFYVAFCFLLTSHQCMSG